MNADTLRKWTGVFWGFCLSAWILGCESSPTNPPPDPIDTASTSISYLALGDSYTIGEGVAILDRWPMQLAAKARQCGIPLSDPEIIARTGWTTGQLASAMDADQPQGPYGLVSLLIGVNNQYRGLSIEQYRIEFDSLLTRAIALAGGKPERVLVLSIPDWGASFFGRNSNPETIAKEIDAFNEANRSATQAHGARYVDITPASRAASGDKSQFAPDGLHPSGLMYSAWAELAVGALSRLPVGAF